MEKAEFIEKAREAGADQQYIDWAISFHDEDAADGFAMPFDILLKGYLDRKNVLVS